MSKRNRYNWPELFSAFEQSNVTQSQFCQQHGLNPKYFNLKLNKHRATEPSRSSRFTELVIEDGALPSSGFVIEVGHCRLHCPSSLPIASLVTVLRQLA